MDASVLAAERVVGGTLMILSWIVFAVGGYLFMNRAIRKRPAAQSTRYLQIERGFVIAALLLLVLGLALLERILEAAGDAILAPLAMVTFLVGAVSVIVAESMFLNGREWLYPSVIIYVVLAFLAQAAFGVALLETRLLPLWVGWATIVWNLAWLIILPIRRKDMYYPWLHHTAPLVIGIALVLRLGG